MIPGICPNCGAELNKKAIRLAEGEDRALLVLELCSKNINHYKHYREASFEELREGIR